MPKPLTESEILERVKSNGFQPTKAFSNDGKWFLTIQCQCGTPFNVSYKHIISGHTKSCGCLQRKDLTGCRFGKLVVLKQVPRKDKSYHARWWRCQCDCGNVTETITNSLTNGSTSTCGCSRFGENSCQWKGYKCISGKFWSLLKHSSSRRNLQLKISKQYAYSVLEKQGFKCSLTGVPITIHIKNDSNTASLDRIDSSEGYIQGNIQWVHKRINKMKMEYSQSDFIEWCKKVASWNKK